jgi:hypothetical protein
MLVSTLLNHLDEVHSYLVEAGFTNVEIVKIAESKDVFTFSAADEVEDSFTIVTTQVRCDDGRILYEVKATNKRTMHTVYVGDAEIL